MSDIASSLAGVDRDGMFIDRILYYRSMKFLALPINSEIEVQKRSADFVYRAVKARIDRDRNVWAGMLSALTPLMSGESINQVPHQQINDVDPYWNNGYFSGSDARISYALLAYSKSRKVLEVGAGESSKFFRKAIDDFTLGTELTAIDPNPRQALAKICHRVMETHALNAPMAAFESLAAGDILSWDGSHLCVNGSDALRLFLEVLPILKRGVFVHVHDVSLPFEAVRNGMVGDVSYGDQYLLAATLLWNQTLQVVSPVHYLFRSGMLADDGLSFWFQT